MGDRGTDGPERASTWEDAVRGLTRALQLGADLQRRMTRSSLSSLDVGPGYLPRVQEEWRRYATHVTELTVDYYRAVADAARDYGERLSADRAAGHHDGSFDVHHHDERGTRQTTREGADNPTIELRGRPESVLAASFVVENRDPDPAVVTVSVGLARAPDGERFVAPLSVEPASLTIPAGGTAEVNLRLPLLAAVFETNVTYRIPLHVEGPRPTTIEVAVVVEDAVPPPASAADRKTPETDAPIHAEGSSAGDQTATYRVHCPACGRTFERRTANLRLRPHKTSDGDDCPGRDGRRARRG